MDENDPLKEFRDEFFYPKVSNSQPSPILPHADAHGFVLQPAVRLCFC